MNGRSPPLRGARVRLRAMGEDDVPAWFAMQSDPVAMRYWSYPPLTHIDEARQLFEKNRRDAAAGGVIAWAIAGVEDDAMIGTCTLFGIEPKHRRAMLGYALAREHWGSGLAQEALRLVLAHAFATLRLHRLEADIDPRNAASLRLIERLGFSREGLQRERWFVGDDVQDSALYALLAREFDSSPVPQRQNLDAD